ncbi:nucleotidyltransferase family protein [Dolichospermum sp. UHCC 0352]|jgi:NDP-mannose synthase|uniref:sugar phosphate nucleotidyltransferase n=1 Tax=Dolichospermum sp. UHCC 0352 TaxID=2590011 RepID=UPI001446D86A|nr:sugar phosphate nucleotidyltransferase [Dolichospermum sp. UHCC 0352]MTJ21037.1 nucleotidyltransferase family protein [Dolichospermum sp. UHCC 0352]
MRAIILAGGKGTRLKPYTVTIPKPLVPIGGEMPILEIIIRQLANSGFDHITLAVNHLANLIMAFFGDGSLWDVKIDYSLEESPLSTIGPLTLIPDLPDNFLVMNGDILCNFNYLDFYNYHIQADNDVTVSTFKRESKIDFGVLKYNEENLICSFIEKPTYYFDVSMGIYCLNRRVVEKLTKGESYGFDNLMIDGIKNKNKILVKPFDGYWLDIGRPEDYENANENYDQLKIKLGLI